MHEKMVIKRKEVCRKDNIRTGILLAVVAAIFFFGFLVKYYLMR